MYIFVVSTSMQVDPLREAWNNILAVVLHAAFLPEKAA